MNKDKIMVYSTVIILTIIILLASSLKVYQIHNQRLLTVTINAIADSAKKCYYNSSCVDNKITLNELYEKMGLAPQINPKTKKIYNDQSYILVSNNFEFVEVN